jgi:predicted N-formylglutamate amidohydrolase
MVARIQLEHQRKPLVIVSDVSGAIPEQYQALSLTPQQVQYATEALSELDGVHDTLVREAYAAGVAPSVSKLIVDVHENIDSPKLFLQQLGDLVILDNAQLSEREENFRVEEFYIEYHAALRRVLTATQERFGRAYLVFLKKVPRFHKEQELSYDLGIITQNGFSFASDIGKHLDYKVQQNPGFFYYDVLHGPLQDCFEHGRVTAIAILVNEKLLRSPAMKEQLATDLASAISLAIPETPIRDARR